MQEGKIYFLSRPQRFGFGTGTPTYLVRLLSHSQENLDKMTGRYYDQREFIDYKADERKRERYFQYTFYLILRLLGVYAVRAEERQNRGRVDCVVKTPNHVYVFEFKLDGTAAEALRQIEERGYARPYGADGRKVVCVGASFSSETGSIEEWEEKPTQAL